MVFKMSVLLALAYTNVLAAPLAQRATDDTLETLSDQSAMALTATTSVPLMTLLRLSQIKAPLMSMVPTAMTSVPQRLTTLSRLSRTKAPLMFTAPTATRSVTSSFASRCECYGIVTAVANVNTDLAVCWRVGI
ncbi:hypothetical protein F4860DRAFT_497279 [Xylaria cubensis]|nr:hypothetical protein F4860DRAFT_497279 [Xylaria cubensis]